MLVQSVNLPKDVMQAILDAHADESDSIVHFSIDRNDAGHVQGALDVPFSGPSRSMAISISSR